MLKIHKNHSLQKYCTFGIAAKAAELIVINNAEELKSLLPFTKKVLVLGGGSNMIFTTDWSGIVVKNEIRGIDIINENDNYVDIKVGAGENWHDLVLWAIEKGYGGLENLSLIPGTVGASPIQNIGAYGVEVKDLIQKVAAISLENGSLCSFTNAECRFGYRESVFKHELKDKYFITSVIFRLTQQKNHVFNTKYGDIQAYLIKNGYNDTDLTPKAISNAVIAIRKSKLPDPKILGNCGSFFKNPEIPKSHYQKLVVIHTTLPAYPVADPEKVKIPAGWLIEQAGWKGKRVGNTGSHAQQALVLVNYGNATGAEVRDLAYAIIEDIQQKFGVTLLPEVNIL